MAKQNRQHLRQEFQDGERPSGNDFADLIESGINQEDDGIVVDDDQNVSLVGGLTLGNPENGSQGMLRFDGGVVEIHDGADWGPLVPAVGPGGAFQEVDGGPNVAFSGGNVGIGELAAAPTYRLEVELGDNTDEAQRVRFGTVAISNGQGAQQNRAIVAHRDHSTNEGYALAQGPTGETYINTPVGQQISFRQGGSSVRLAVSSEGRVIVNGATELPGSIAADQLQVNGDAYKTQGGEQWNSPSDLRLKADVHDLDRGLADLLAVRPVRFRFNGKAGTSEGAEHFGIIGQEMEKVFPSMVKRVAAQIDEDTTWDDMRVYNGSGLTYVMINAIKELAGRVAQLEAELAAHRRETTHD
jgi:hypothetical protein